MEVQLKMSNDKIIKDITNDQVSVIDSLAGQLERSQGKWNSTGNELEGKLNDGITLKIIFPSSQDGDFKIETDKKGIEYVDLIIKKESQDIKQVDVNKSVFKISLDNIKNGGFLKLKKNIDVFKELDKYFKNLKIKEVGYYDKLISRPEEVVCDEVTLIFNQYDPNGKKPEFNTELLNKYSGLDGYTSPNADGYEINTIAGEKSEDIKLHDIKIGVYYKQRNLILININPFYNVNLMDVMSYKDNKYLTTILDDLKNAITALKIKKDNSEQFKLRILVDAFNKKAKGRVKQMEQSLKDAQQNIESYQQSLTNAYSEQVSLNSQIKALNVVGKDAVDLFIKQIGKVKEQELVDSVELKNGSINITFIPTTIKERIGRNMEGKATSGPFFHMFIGKITCHIYGDGKIETTCDHICDGNHHPHSHGKAPCLGSGDGTNMMHKLIAERNFADFIYIFWMWIKRWRPEDCYIKPHIYIDNRMKHGLPVFDQEGKRVELNDPELIKNKTLIKVSKASDYDDNMEKYKGFKLVK